MVSLEKMIPMISPHLGRHVARQESAHINRRRAIIDRAEVEEGYFDWFPVGAVFEHHVISGEVPVGYDGERPRVVRCIPCH